MAMTMADAANPQAMMMEQEAMNGAPPATNGAPQPTGMGGQDVSGGDMQAQFEAVATPLVEFIQGEGRQDVVDSLAATPEIGRNAGGVIGNMVLAQMTNAAQQANAQIPADIIAQTTLQLANIMADMSIEEGLASEDEGDDIADDAFYNGLADIGEQAPPELLPDEEKQALGQIVAQLEQAEMERENGDSGGMGMNAGVGNGMGATNMSMAAMTAPGAPVEDASIMNAGRFNGNPNGGSLNG